MKTSKKLSFCAAILLIISALILHFGGKKSSISSNDHVEMREANQPTVGSSGNAEPSVATIEPEDASAQTSERASKGEKQEESSIAHRSIEELATIVLDTKQDPNFRREALAELTEAGPQAIPLLATIAATDVVMPDVAKDPHSAEAYTFQFEKGLRITALEVIDQWAARNADVRAALQSIIKKTRDQDLRFMAFVSLRGVEQGRPGKLTRFIDQMFEEFENSL